MNLDTLAEQAGNVIDPTPETLLAGRSRLDDAVDAAGVRVSVRRSRRRPRRLGLTALVGAAAAVVALSVTPVLLPRHTPGSVEPAAAAVLDQAARIAENTPVVNVPPHSYIFTESIGERTYPGQKSDSDPSDAPYDGIPRRSWRRSWLPAYGGGDPMLLQDRHGTQRWISDRESLDKSDPGAYRDDLPTTMNSMLRYLYSHSQGGNPPDDQAFVTVGDLMREAYIRPTSLAALYRATGRIPGTIVLRNQKDLLDRPAIAIGLDNGSAINELLFDPTTYAFLGEKTVLTHSGKQGSKGAVLESSAVTRSAVVTRIGELPPRLHR